MSAPAIDSRSLFGASTAILAPRTSNMPPRTMPQYKTQDIPYSRRAIKQAPLPTHSQLNETRRQNLLGAVKSARDDWQFERRANDILRSDFMRKKRLWEAQLMEAGQLQGQDVEEEIEEMLPDEIERAEDQELEILLTLLEEDTSMDLEQEPKHEEHESEHYGSDDGDELEVLMYEVAQRYDRLEQSSAGATVHLSAQSQQVDMMDMS